MATSLFRWLTRRTTDRFAPAPGARPVRSARLGVEALEDRVVPALHIWTGAANDLWSEPGNWDGGVPTSNEEGGTRVSFQGNTASAMDIPTLQIDLLELDGANNAITLRAPLTLYDVVTRDGAHTITGAPVLFAPNVVTGDSIVEVNDDSTLVIDSPFSGFLTLRKTGAGALALRDGPDSSGTIFVEQGTLEVSTDGFLNGAVRVNGGKLTGGGTIRAVADSLGGGLIAPGGGTSTAVLTIGTGAFAALTYEPTIAGAGSDRINLIGLLDLTGTALNVQILQPPTAASYTLIDNSGTDPITGTFNDLPEGSAVFLAGRGYTLSYVGGDGNDVVLIRAGEPPAPSVPPVSPAPRLTSQPPPAFSGAQVVGRLLVLSGASVPDGIQFTPVPLGSSALFTDLTGDGNGDVVLLLSNMMFVLDGQTGRLLALDADDNGDGVPDLQIFNPDGTTTRIDGRAGLTRAF